MDIDLDEMFMIDKKPSRGLIKKSGKVFYKYITTNDEYLVMNLSFMPIYVITVISLGILFPLLFILTLSTGSYHFWKVYGFLLLPILLYRLVLTTKGGKKRLIFNRMDQTITYTYPFFNRKTTTEHLKDVNFGYRAFSNEEQDHVLQLVIYRKDSNSVIYLQRGNIIDYDAKDWKENQPKIHEFLNMLWWYMDKNRPLPPCKVFDPYREKDYERRKEEGFPEGIHPSTIETPDVGLSS